MTGCWRRFFFSPAYGAKEVCTDSSHEPLFQFSSTAEAFHVLKNTHAFEVRGAERVKGVFLRSFPYVRPSHRISTYSECSTLTNTPSFPFGANTWNESYCYVLVSMVMLACCTNGSPRNGIYQQKTGTLNCLNSQKQHSRLTVTVEI